MQKNLVQVSFPVLPFDEVVSIGSEVFPPGTNCLMLDSMPDSGYWIAKNSSGLERLCTTKPFGTSLPAQFLISGLPVFMEAEDFVLLSGFGLQPHPIHAPK